MPETIPDVWRLECVWNYRSETAVNTFHIRRDQGVFTYPLPQDEMDLLTDAVSDLKKFYGSAAGIGSLIASEAVLELIRARHVGVIGGQVLEFPGQTQGAGGAALPTQLSPVISWRTARVGRSFRGRTYLPFPAQNTVDTGGHRIKQTSFDAIGNSAGQLLDDLADGPGPLSGTPLVIASYKLGSAEVVTGGKVGRLFDTVRRRRNALPEEYVPIP